MSSSSPESKSQPRKRPTRHVSDEEMREAMENIDNQNVIFKVLRRYARQFDQDELEQARLHIYWLTLQGHKSDHPSGQKFTSSLVRFAHWHLANELASKKRAGRRAARATERATHSLLESMRPGAEPDFAGRLESILKRLPESYCLLLKQVYLDGISVEEVARQRGCPPDAVKKIIGNALCIARNESRAMYD